MTGAIQFGTLGVDTGPFYIYSDVNGFTAPFEQNINRKEYCTKFFKFVVNRCGFVSSANKN